MFSVGDDGFAVAVADAVRRVVSTIGELLT
jgi:hypothetical protein